MQAERIPHGRGLRRWKPLRYVEEDRGYDTSCWIWQLMLNEEGYGRVRFDGRYRPAHAVYYERFVGPIPTGLHIDHLCRVPACVNPDHLEPVTSAENVRRSRAVRLRATERFMARLMYATTSLTHRDIADVFGVAHGTIGRALRGQSWKE